VLGDQLAEDIKTTQQPPQQRENNDRGEAAASQLVGTPPGGYSTQ